MDNVNIKLHYYQKALIKKLSQVQSLNFNSLIIDGLESEHMNYHLKQLISFKLVAKDKDGYYLTDSGKDFFNLMDEETDLIEKQPKTSIIINGIRINKKGLIENLLTRRLRHPYYGKVGRITGKVKFGETLKEAAERELFEETGLHAKYFVLEEIYHKIRTREDGTTVQDVIFYIFFVTNFTGTFIEKTQYQENFWVTKSEFNEANFDSYRDLKIYPRKKPHSLIFTESLDLARDY